MFFQKTAFVGKEFDPPPKKKTKRCASFFELIVSIPFLKVDLFRYPAYSNQLRLVVLSYRFTMGFLQFSGAWEWDF